MEVHIFQQNQKETLHKKIQLDELQLVSSIKYTLISTNKNYVLEYLSSSLKKSETDLEQLTFMFKALSDLR